MDLAFGDLRGDHVHHSVRVDQDSPCVKFDINEVRGQEKGYRVLEMKLFACDPM